MKDAVTVYMVQVMPTLWRIETKDGIVLQDDIRAYSLREAEKYVANYISTWYHWKYELKPI